MHVLIVGQTESGKSTFARRMAQSFHQSGKPIAVYDPTYGKWPVTPFVKIEPFIREVRKVQSAFLFVDEAAYAYGEEEAPYWFATMSRHLGHSFVFITQRAAIIPRTVRDQCSRLVMFNSSLYDCEVLSEEWAAPLLEAARYARGEYVICDRYGSWSKGSLFNLATGQTKSEHSQPRSPLPVLSSGSQDQSAKPQV